MWRYEQLCFTIKILRYNLDMSLCKMKIKCSECGYVFEALSIPRNCPDCYKGPLFEVIEHRFEVGSTLNLKQSRVQVVRKVLSGEGAPYYVVSNESGSGRVPEAWLEDILRF